MKNIKNKKLNLLLIMILLIVWGAVLMRFFNSEKIYSSPNSNYKINDHLENYSAANISVKDTFRNVNLSRDPFNYQFEKKVSNKSKSIKNVVDENKKQFEYKINGLIMSGSSKVAVILDLNESKTIFLREGETYKDLKVRSIHKNEIYIRDGKGDKTHLLNSK